MDIIIYADRDGGDLPHFWRSTGFSPASLLLNDDMQQQMIYAAATGGIEHVRIHYLLDLIQATGTGTSSVAYDWSALNVALDVLVENRLRPFFELMGNPSGYFDDFTDDTQLRAWRQLVYDLALHLINRYGADTVRGWYFESWNEPDAWWQFGITGYINYYDACSEGLKMADESLRFGGPCTSETLSPYFKALIAHCDSGTNYFTGESGVRLDFISIHEKGAPPTREDITPNTLRICEKELAAVTYIGEHHPRFAALPFMNNECDPQVGWQQHHSWRGQPYYAAIVCRMIAQHLWWLHDENGVNYALLSNDHGFVGEWGQRTLTTRFGQIEDGAGQMDHRTMSDDLRPDPTRRAFELIKKPVLNVMSLLNLLGERRCVVSNGGTSETPIGVIATRRDAEQVAVLVYHSRDRFYSDGDVEINLNIHGLPFETGTVVHYRIDENHGNPFAEWEAHGANRYPHTVPKVYPAMRHHHELSLWTTPRPITRRDVSLTFRLPLPGVSLLLFNADNHAPLQPPSRLRLRRYDGLMVPGMMLAWDAPENAHLIRTYHVEHAETADGEYERVNPLDTIQCAFLHHIPPNSGWYRVCAVDYQGRITVSEPIAIILEGE